MSEAISGIPQGSVILPGNICHLRQWPADHLSADTLLYADDAKLIASRNRDDVLQNPLNISVSWSKDWELDLNPTKSEHLPIGNSPPPISSLTPSCPITHPDNTKRIPKVSTTRDLESVLNTRLSAEGNVVSAANKARRVLFYLKRPFAALIQNFYPATSWICYSSNPSQPIPRRRGIEEGTRSRSKIREKASACSVWSSSQTASSILSYTPAKLLFLVIIVLITPCVLKVPPASLSPGIDNLFVP